MDNSEKDMEAILAGLDQPNRESRERTVTRDMLRNWAESFAERGYVLDGDSLSALRDYLRGYGVFLSGPVGVGKTRFFQIMSELGPHLFGDMEIFPMYSILGMGESEVRSRFDALAKKEVVLDDIGSEPLFNNYGVKYDVLNYIVNRRLESRVRTHFTTNLSRRELTQRYGQRTMDRLAELCRFTDLKGQSRRSARVFLGEGREERYASRFDWTLCRERCARMRDGRCLAGYTVPPPLRQWPQPPEKCLGFLKSAPEGGEAPQNRAEPRKTGLDGVSNAG